ncbi:MobV family relaxase [Thomasclavelia spiroformis]|uniref:MobV family relaxase n=1 Tax=Thomasclavelia spiroformis TaxID=29348 RepID=UPI00255BB832|nr:MobV family relaxase [Thomasclavelia spiroformis]
MSYAIMRMEKRNASNIVGMFKHNERKNENYSNEDINRELSSQNYQLIECDSYKEKINQEIKERYKVNKSIRKDAVLCVETVFTSDKEFFDKLTPEQEKIYFEKSVEFLKEQFGEKNIIFATVHKDETTPHLHAGFIPMTDDGRLSYKNFVNSKYDLIKLQDKYFEKMVELFPELERGQNSKETKAKHIANQEYKIQQKEKAMELQLEQINKNAMELEEKKKKLEAKKERLKLEDEKLYELDNVLKHVEEKKKLFKNETIVSMDKEIYKSLVKYAREGEGYLKKLLELEKNVEKLEKENLNYLMENKSLSDRNMVLESKKINLELELQEYRLLSKNLGELLQDLGYDKVLEECQLYSKWKNGNRLEKKELENKILEKDEKELNKAEKMILKGLEEKNSWEKVVARQTRGRNRGGMER